MTADELHDSFWLFYGDMLEDFGVEQLEIHQDPGGMKGWYVRVGHSGLPTLELAVPAGRPPDPHIRIGRALADVVWKYWMYRCELCHQWFLKGWSDEEAKAEHLEEFGREVVAATDAVVCDDCYEVVLAGPIAALRSMGEEP